MIMKLIVDQIGPSPDHHDFEAPPQWWEARQSLHEPGVRVTSPIHFAVDAQKMGEQLLVTGEMATEIDAECSRCTARYRHRLAEPFRLVLDPAGERVPADPEGAEALKRDGLCLGEEIEAGWYRGPEIGLAAFFSEIVALALPVQPLCSEACKGLCSRCGTDLNLGLCDCPDVRPDSPFAALAGLKLKPN